MPFFHQNIATRKAHRFIILTQEWGWKGRRNEIYGRKCLIKVSNWWNFPSFFLRKKAAGIWMFTSSDGIFFRIKVSTKINCLGTVNCQTQRLPSKLKVPNKSSMFCERKMTDLNVIKEILFISFHFRWQDRWEEAEKCLNSRQIMLIMLRILGGMSL